MTEDDDDPRTPAVTVPQVSRNCHTGNHRRCLGTTFIYPPAGGTHIVTCECVVPECGHGAPAGQA